MHLEAPGMISGSGSTKRIWGSPTVSVAEVIKRVEADDPTLTVVDFSNSASYQMKGDDFTAQLAEALKKNTRVRELNLTNCSIGDRGGEFLGQALAENNSVVTLLLEKNRLNQHGASAIAKGLANNKKLETINLMNQTNSRWGDSCLDDWIEMFHHNVTLIKIFWRLESRKSFAINKMLTRNFEIDRRKKNGMSYDDLLPEAVRGTDSGADSRQGKSPVFSSVSAADRGGSREKSVVSSLASRSDQESGASGNGSPAVGFGSPPVGYGSPAAQAFSNQHASNAEAKVPSTPDHAATCGSLRDRLKMFQQACQSTPGPVERSATTAAPRRTWGNPTASVAELIRRIDSNDATLTSVELANSASYQMRSDDYTAQLSAALARNTRVKEVNLSNCGINDRGAEHLGRALASNQSVTTLVLERNRIGPAGAAAIARGLATNKSLETLNLMDQGGGSRFGDTCLDEFIVMLGINVSLLKIFWRLDSRKSVTVNRLLTRNSEIDRRKRNNMSYSDLVPDTSTAASANAMPIPMPLVSQPSVSAGAPAVKTQERSTTKIEETPFIESSKVSAFSAGNGPDRSDYGPPLWGSEVKVDEPVAPPAPMPVSSPMPASSFDSNGFHVADSTPHFTIPQSLGETPEESTHVHADAVQPPRPVTPPKANEAISAYDLLQQYAISPPKEAEKAQVASPMYVKPEGFEDYIPQVPYAVPDVSKNNGPDVHGHDSLVTGNGNGNGLASKSVWDD